MGCTLSVVNNTVENESETSPVSYPVPFGHVPYTPSLPAAMGPIWDFPMEWWYYAGWATDVKGNRYTILMQTLRFEKSAALLYGIGVDKEHGCLDLQSFFTHWAPGSGNFPIPTSKSWQTQFSNPTANMSCSLASGVLGLSGATYNLQMADNAHDIKANLVLMDSLGMILEGPSGAYHKGGGGSSYEYAAPCLTIQTGSTITINGVSSQLVNGNLWLDRQTVTIDPNKHSHLSQLTQPSASESVESHPLYIGNWLAVVMKDGTVYNLTFFWPMKTEQWIVGTKLNPPIPPINKFGLEYPPQNTWDKSSPVQGVNVLKSDEFDLNLLNPQDTANTPHWTSPESGQVYGTAWQLTIKGQNYTMKALVQSSEVQFGTQYFFEGAASITNEENVEVGHAVVEQMGYN